MSTSTPYIRDGEVHLPAAFAEQAGVAEGDSLVAERQDGAIVLRPRSISGELAADIAAGYGQERMRPEEFFAEIERQRAG